MNGLQYRRTVRNAVNAALAQSFNTNHLALADTYGVDPIALDFSDGSGNVLLANVNPDDVELTHFIDLNPAGIAIATDRAIDTGRTRGIRFDGAVLFCVYGIYSPRFGAENSDTESAMDAFEDAVLLTLNEYVWPITNEVSLAFTRETSISRSKLSLLADGFRQWFELVGKVQVRVP